MFIFEPGKPIEKVYLFFPRTETERCSSLWSQAEALALFLLSVSVSEWRAFEVRHSTILGVSHCKNVHSLGVLEPPHFGSLCQTMSALFLIHPYHFLRPRFLLNFRLFSLFSALIYFFSILLFSPPPPPLSRCISIFSLAA